MGVGIPLGINPFLEEQVNCAVARTERYPLQLAA
jgi:hypothetical protein